MLSPIVPEAQVIRCETPTLSARRRSSIFEETLTPDSSECRWVLDIISEDEQTVKELAHFVLSENQLILVLVFTLDVQESQVQLGIKDEGCSEFDIVIRIKQEILTFLTGINTSPNRIYDELLYLQFHAELLYIYQYCKPFVMHDPFRFFIPLLHRQLIP
ncbi:MAG: hypothetical protein EZS28_010438 [Streblomastix strix]|uniref:Uncharacterized protein n=1 Tax=Streblomastix strix TaxID=222440 RepID=A0A5J4WH60_9EUKA|nr:MAG: hypothetical protein EZS28_010438 [Streblomastix strix]